MRLRWSPAKINLVLEVGSRMANGYHDLVTLMFPLSLADRLGACRCHDGIELTVRPRMFGAQTHDPVSEVPSDERNLVVKIARGFLARYSLPGGVRFCLQKRIPAGGGLGGASSNAAVALQLLNELFETHLSWRELAEFSAAYGSDIAFFLQPNTAVCRGRGEQVQPLAVPNMGWFVIVRPPYGLATPAVFQKLAEQRQSQPVGRSSELRPGHTDKVVKRLNQGRLSSVGHHLRNDLQAAAVQLRPELVQVDQQVRQTHPSGSQMSGSGSCWFAMYPHRKRALWASHRLRATRVGLIDVVKPISQLPINIKG